jgi:predicted DNA-binding transcriptional regulator AlpA
MSTNPISARLLTVQQVAKHFGVAERTVWRWEALGTLPRGLRLTRNTVRWREEEIERHVASLAPRAEQPTT